MKTIYYKILKMVIYWKLRRSGIDAVTAEVISYNYVYFKQSRDEHD